MHHRRRLAWVSACAVAVIMIGSAVLIGAVGTARAGPDVICCGEFFSNVSVVDNATNVTISYTAAFSGLSPFTVYFGNTSSGEIYSQTATYNATTLEGQVFIDFLEPSTTYDFTLGDGGTCIHGGIEYYCSYSSSFTTHSDSYNSFWGIVTNAAGDPLSNVAVFGECLSPYSGSSYALTSSQGAYEFNIPGGPCGNGFLVQTVNWYISPIRNTVWSGVWNETVVTFGSQDINFDLPANFLGPLTPEVLDFTNDSYVTFGYQSTFYASTSSCWSFEGEQQCTSFTSSNLVGLDGSAGSNLEYYVAYMTTGSVEFNAISGRTASTLSWSYTGQPVSTELSSNIVSDPVSAFYTGIGSTEVCHAQTPGAGAQTYTTTYSQSFQLSSTFDLDISVSVDLYGVSLSTPLLQYSNSLSNGGGSAWTMSYTIHVPSGGSTTNVWVYVQPGSPNQVGPVVHAWAGPSCPP